MKESHLWPTHFLLALLKSCHTSLNHDCGIHEQKKYNFCHAFISKFFSNKINSFHIDRAKFIFHSLNGGFLQNHSIFFKNYFILQYILFYFMNMINTKNPNFITTATMKSLSSFIQNLMCRSFSVVISFILCFTLAVFALMKKQKSEIR